MSNQTEWTLEHANPEDIKTILEWASRNDIYANDPFSNYAAIHNRIDIFKVAHQLKLSCDCQGGRASYSDWPGLRAAEYGNLDILKYMKEHNTHRWNTGAIWNWALYCYRKDKERGLAVLRWLRIVTPEEDIPEIDKEIWAQTV